ncbi:MAG: redoxin family protein [Paenibacillus sp.]|nr:redoxin family protein [Paenibacillus sp.]
MKTTSLSLLAGCMVLASCTGGSEGKQSLSPTYACDSAVVNITVVGYDSVSNGYIDALVNSYDDITELTPRHLDSNGCITLTFDMQGDKVLSLFNTSSDGDYGRIRIAPGETTDVTIYPDSIVTTGRFANLNRVINSYQPKYSMDLFNPDFVRYDMTGDEYTSAILAKYTGLKQALDADSSLSPAQRVIEEAELLNSLLSFASNRELIGRGSYMIVNPGKYDIPRDSILTDMSEANYRSVINAIDPDSEALLGGLCSVATSMGDVDWSAMGAAGTLLGTVSDYRKAARQAYENKLDSTLIASLQAYSNPFFAQAVGNISDIAKARFEKVAKLVSPTPDVPAGEIIDAIAAQFPGKVVLIDRWNTWCGPCKAGIAENEPLKQTTLSDPDIVWVYVADESSPIPAYYKMIPDIKGQHYRLSEEQARAIYDRYNIDGIPYYFIVDRKGTVTPRPDFRDHDLLVSTILDELKK